MEKYDVIIIGAGPAGLFAANELVHSNNKIRVLVVDKGEPPELRKCPALEGQCRKCEVCHIVHGGGGAGLFSDGKLILDLKFGGNLVLQKRQRDILVDKIEQTLLKYDGKSVYSNPEKDDVSKWRRIFNNQDIELKSYAVRHLGSINLRSIITSYIKDLTQKGIEFLFEADVIGIEADNHIKEIDILRNGAKSKLFAEYLVFAVGKTGSRWLNRILSKIGVSFEKNRAYFGVRIETSNDITDELMSLSYDPKIYRVHPDGTKIKTHCFCRHGQVILTRYNGLPLVGGHTIYTENGVSDSICQNYHNTNFAVLLGDTAENPVSWNELQSYLRKVNKLTDGKLMVQRLGDFKAKRPTTPDKLVNNAVEPSNLLNIVPGNIAGLDLPLGFNEKFLTFLGDLDKVITGLYRDENLIYAPAVEWWMDKVSVNQNMETTIPGIYAVGDGAGLSQGIVHAGATGILAARDILKKNAFV